MAFTISMQSEFVSMHIIIFFIIIKYMNKYIKNKNNTYK